MLQEILDRIEESYQLARPNFTFPILEQDYQNLCSEVAALPPEQQGQYDELVNLNYKGVTIVFEQELNAPEEPTE